MICIYYQMSKSRIFKDKNIMYEMVRVIGADILPLSMCNKELNEFLNAFIQEDIHAYANGILYGKHLDSIQVMTVKRMMQPTSMNIIAPCGYGKSRCVLISAININKPTIVLVPNIVLMRTLIEEAEKLGMSNNKDINSDVLFYMENRRTHKLYINTTPLCDINSVIVMTVSQMRKKKIKDRISNELNDLVIIRDEAHKGVKLETNYRTILVSATYTYNDNITWFYKRYEPRFKINCRFIKRDNLEYAINKLNNTRKIKSIIIATQDVNEIHSAFPDCIKWRGDGVKSLNLYKSTDKNIIIPHNISEGINLYKSNAMIIDIQINDLPMQLIGRMVRERSSQQEFIVVCMDDSIITKIKVRIACYCTIHHYSTIELKDEEFINRIINEKKLDIDELTDKDLIYLFCHSNITWGDIQSESNMSLDQILNIGFYI